MLRFVGEATRSGSDRDPAEMEPSPVKIRRVVSEEWPAVRELRLEALQTDPLAFGSTFARELDFADSVWIDRVSKAAISPSSATWIAEHRDGTFVGMVGAYVQETTIWVVGMWVRPSFRGLRLGSRLLDSLLQWTRATRPEDEVKLEVNPALEVAVLLYRGRGFVPTGLVRGLDHAPGAQVIEMLLPKENRRSVGYRLST